MTIGIDTTPPVCSMIMIDSREPGGEFYFTKNNRRLEAYWECTDAPPYESAPLKCEWAVGTFPSGNDQIEWGTAMAKGTHVAQPIWAFQSGVMLYVSVPE